MVVIPCVRGNKLKRSSDRPEPSPEQCSAVARVYVDDWVSVHPGFIGILFVAANDIHTIF
jgi:hypothetical protein